MVSARRSSYSVRWLSHALLLGVLGVGVGFGLALGSRLLPPSSVEPRAHALRGEDSIGAIPNNPAPADRSKGVIHTTPDAVNLAQTAGKTEPGLPPNSQRHTRVVDVAQSVSPAVVSIGITKSAYVRQYDTSGGEDFFSPYTGTMLDRDFPYLGSGFIIDADGHVVTNYHVVQDASAIRVTLTDGRSYTARLLDADTFVDVALLQIEGRAAGDKLPVVPLGDSDGILIGESVVAVGNPFGPLLADPRPSVSVGVVSAANRSVKSDDLGDHFFEDLIQTDAAINPGNSGGPLVNLDGEAVGINTFLLSSSGDSAGGGFSIPINRVRKIVGEILRFGKLRAIHPGFEVRNVSTFLIERLHLSAKTGALVWSIEVSGPAAAAKLAPGDVITAVSGKAIANVDDLMMALRLRSPGDRLKFRVLRRDKELDVEYVVAAAVLQQR